MVKKYIVALLLALLMAALPACGNRESASGKLCEAWTSSATTQTGTPAPLTGEETAALVPNKPPEFQMATVPGADYYQDLSLDEPEIGFINPIVDYHTVSYALSKTEVTYELWYAVRVWAEANGYRFRNEGCEGSRGSAGGADGCKA